MRAAPKLFWIVVLAFFVSSCSSYRQGLIPTPAAAGAEAETGDPVAVGDFVRLTLNSGDRAEGRVGKLDRDGILLVARGNFAFEDLFVSYSDIEHIEIREQSDAKIEGRWLSGIAIVLVISGFLAFISYDWN